MICSVRVQAETFHSEREAGLLRAGRTDIGAVVCFTGYCRDEAGTLAALEIEHFAGMAEAEIERVARDAERRWPLLGLTVIHRFGLIRPGEPIVLVAAASAHRAAAFQATDFLMDFLKTAAPFWKREHRLAGVDEAGAAEAWVMAKDTDSQAAARWTDAEVDAASLE